VSGITAKQNTCAPPVCNPLAVTFIDLAGRFSAGKVFLQWDTEQEGNVTEYSIEKSAGGTSFAEFGRQAAAGNSQNHYEVEDLLPFPQSTYYRIKALNADGSIAYSNVINIAIPERSVYFSSPFPNPAAHAAGITIHSITDEDITMQLITADGRIAYMEIIRATRGVVTRAIPTEKYASGMYLVIFRDGSGKLLQKERLLIQ
jgi:hypothetical protein